MRCRPEPYRRIPSPEPTLFLAARTARLVGDLPGAAALTGRLREVCGTTEDVQVQFLLLRAVSGELPEVYPGLSRTARDGHPRAEEILEAVAFSQIARMETPQAHATLLRLTELAPDSARGFEWLGWVRTQASDPAGSAVAYARPLELAPDRHEVRLLYAEALLSAKHDAEARAQFESLEGRLGGRPEVRTGLARCLHSDPAAYDRAAGLYRAVLAAHPDHLPALIGFARLLMDHGGHAEAVVLLARAERLDDLDAEIPWLQAMAAREVPGRYDEVAGLLRRHEELKAKAGRIHTLINEAIPARPTDPGLLTELGGLLLWARQEPVAVVWLGRALDADRAYEPAHRLLCDHFEAKGDRERAAAHRRFLKPGIRP